MKSDLTPEKIKSMQEKMGEVDLPEHLVNFFQGLGRLTKETGITFFDPEVLMNPEGEDCELVGRIMTPEGFDFAIKYDPGMKEYYPATEIKFYLVLQSYGDYWACADSLKNYQETGMIKLPDGEEVKPVEDLAVTKEKIQSELKEIQELVSEINHLDYEFNQRNKYNPRIFSGLDIDPDMETNLEGAVQGLESLMDILKMIGGEEDQDKGEQGNPINALLDSLKAPEGMDNW